jgi:putative lipoprotein
MRRLLLALALVLTSGCAQTPPGTLKGTATYHERISLPADAVFEATLEDISKADAKAEVIGRARVERPGNPPIVFRIPYDPARIDASHRYVVRARILVEGRMLFTSDQAYRVLSGGKGAEVAMTLRMVGSASLENTYWKLVRLAERPVTAPERQREAHLILHPADGRVSGSGGCNRLTGSYELEGERLTFGRMAGTMMACRDGMDTERAFLDALSRVRRARVLGQQLQLFDSEDKSVARFEAVYLR